MAKRPIQGIKDGQVIDVGGQTPDVRPIFRRLGDWLNIPANVVVAILVLAGTCWWMADLSAYFFVFGLFLTLWGLSRPESAPLKMPIQANIADPNQPHPFTGAPTPGQGIFYLGNDLQNGKEAWLTNSDCRQHFLVLGTTGAGKATDENALVHTPSGWQRLGNLNVGDEVSTPFGHTARIDGYFPQGELEMCEITLEDGRVVHGCPEHLWEICDGDSPVNGHRTVSSLEISRILSDGGRLSIRPVLPLEQPPGEASQSPTDLGSRIAQGAADAEDYDDFIATAFGSVAQRVGLVRSACDKASGSLRLPLGWSDAFADAVRSLGGLARIEDDQLTVTYDLDLGRRWIGISGVRRNARRAQAACIHIDHPGHLFVLEGWVSTHNTESLLGFGANALSWGSGFLFCDGKGDVSLFAKGYAMARRFGREDDLLVLNFMNGTQEGGQTGGKIRSNTMNPFATGSSDGLTQMVVSLMDDVGGDGAMWKGRATAMLTGIMRALCFLRDEGYLDLNVAAIRDHMSLREIIALSDENKYPDLPVHIRKSIRSYLSSLPGYQEDKKEKQAQTTLDQHGYLEMQFTKILGSLADVYGHIFATPYGDVDMYDVVLNRRILFIMLPALEKSGDEIANLGKIVVATLKGMMGATLGNSLEGSWQEVVENRATNSPSPFLCILDEVGYYTVEGMALMAAQARSLGFSMVYASQDIPAMKRLNEKEAASIIANTNTKIFMRTEEVGETGKLAVETGGKALRARIQGFERENSEVSGVSYQHQENAGFEMSDKVDFLDLKGQNEGEMHVLFQDKLCRLRGFYANPEGSVDRSGKSFRISPNHFLKVPKPTIADLKAGINMPLITAKLCSQDLLARLTQEIASALGGIQEAADSMDEIALVSLAYDAMMKARRPPIESACAAVARVITPMHSVVKDFAGNVRSSYAEAPSAPYGGFTDDFESEGNGRHQDPRFKGERMDPDDLDFPFGMPSGVPMADNMPQGAAVRRPFSAPPKKPTRVDPVVRHGATVNDGPIIDMANRMSSNDAIMRSLASLDFVEDMITAEQVEARLQVALGASVPVNKADARTGAAAVVGKVGEFERASAAVNATSDAHRGHASKVDEDSHEGGELVSAFLEGLLTDGDED